MAVVEAERRLFTIEEFDRLFEVGFFTEDDRVEFIDGDVIWMSSIGGRHVGTITRLDRVTQRVIGDQYAISVQNPIRIRDRASFLPDLVIPNTAEIANVVPSAGRYAATVWKPEKAGRRCRNSWSVQVPGIQKTPTLASSSTGSGSIKSVRTTLKTADVPPTPSASVSTASAVYVGRRSSRRAE